MKIRYYFSLLSLAVLPMFASEWELISTRDVGFPEDRVSPIPVTSCLDRELPNFENATIYRGAAVELKAYDDQGLEEENGKPEWRKIAKRNTCRALVGELRAELLNPKIASAMGLSIAKISEILRKAA